MSGSVTFNVSGIETDIRDFPDGPVEAEIVKAEVEVSKKGNPMVVLTYQVFHPEHGEATVKDFMVPSDHNYAKKKAAHFYAAFNGVTMAEAIANGDYDLDPNEVKGGRMIIVLGVNDNGYKSIVDPWFYSETQTDVLPYMQEAAL
jgi:hypothetical protein